MEQYNFDIFISAFFSDKKRIDKLIASEKDIDLTFDNAPSCNHSKKDSLRFSVLDILQMNLDCWHSILDNDQLKSNQKINPKQFYQDTLECFNSILRKFPGIKYDGVNYENYINLILNFDDNDNWFEEHEIRKYEIEGYRRIDLELINYGVRRNVNKVTELLIKGANPMIDPDDKIFESEILQLLSADESFHFSCIISLHERKIINGYESFQITDSNDLVYELYASASSAKLYDIISEQQKKNSR